MDTRTRAREDSLARSPTLPGGFPRGKEMAKTLVGCRCRWAEAIRLSMTLPGLLTP